MFNNNYNYWQHLEPPTCRLCPWLCSGSRLVLSTPNVLSLPLVVFETCIISPLRAVSAPGCVRDLYYQPPTCRLCPCVRDLYYQLPTCHLCPWLCSRLVLSAPNVPSLPLVVFETCISPQRAVSAPGCVRDLYYQPPTCRLCPWLCSRLVLSAPNVPSLPLVVFETCISAPNVLSLPLVVFGSLTSKLQMCGNTIINSTPITSLCSFQCSGLARC